MFKRLIGASALAAFLATAPTMAPGLVAHKLGTTAQAASTLCDYFVNPRTSDEFVELMAKRCKPGEIIVLPPRFVPDVCSFSHQVVDTRSASGSQFACVYAGTHQKR